MLEIKTNDAESAAKSLLLVLAVRAIMLLIE